MSDYINIGKIVNTHGIKGDLKVIPLTNDITRFEDLEYIYIEDENDKFYIKDVWYQKSFVMLKFVDYDNINDVLKFKNKYISIHKDNLVELPEDTYFIFDLIDMDVFTVDEIYIGKINDVIQAGGNDVYIIKKDNKELLIPAAKEIIKDINIEDKKMIIEPIEGLIE